jgi:hypothetical protein
MALIAAQSFQEETPFGAGRISGAKVEKETHGRVYSPI